MQFFVKALERELKRYIPSAYHHYLSGCIRRAKQLDRERREKRYVCAHCGEPCVDWYMVRNDVWRSAFPDRKRPRGFLHLRCLEHRIGRQLTADDLQDLPVNSVALHFMGRPLSGTHRTEEVA